MWNLKRKKKKKSENHRNSEQSGGCQSLGDGVKRGDVGQVYKLSIRDFPGGAVVKNLPANAGHTGSSPGPGRSHMLRSS